MPGKSPDSTLRILAELSVDRSGGLVRRSVATAREHLDMDVGFVVELVDGRDVLQAVDGDVESFGLEEVEGHPLATEYGRRLVDGRLANVVVNARADPAVRDLAETSSFGVGSFVGVPITFSDGRLFGVLCCMSHACDPSLSESDVGIMQILGRLIGDELERQRISADKERLELDRIRRALDDGSVSMVFQPIVDLADGATVGVEALARFGGEPEHSPIMWFEEAEAIGLRTDLELVAARAALAQLPRIPRPIYLAVNVSPQTILSPRFLELLSEVAADRVLVEITEHAPVVDYGSLKAAIRRIQGLGARVAIDDTGAGFASLANIYRLEPDVIKLDISLTRGIDHDPVRRSLASSLVDFGHGIDAAMTAEGIETKEEEETVRALGVGFGQGWYLARPVALEDIPESDTSVPYAS